MQWYDLKLLLKKFAEAEAVTHLNRYLAIATSGGLNQQRTGVIFWTCIFYSSGRKVFVTIFICWSEWLQGKRLLRKLKTYTSTQQS